MQMLVVDSPLRGPYCYEWDIDAGFWKSTTNEHYLDGALVKDFVSFSKGFLRL